MPTYDTPEPISVTLDLLAGNARLIASDRTDTVVEVRPSDESNESDRKAVEETQVEFADGRLLVKRMKHRRYSSLFRGTGTIDVTIELPAGSGVEGDAALADFRSEGRLGECRLKASMGNIRLDSTGPLHLSTSLGTITVLRAVGHTEVTTASGDVRIGEVDGTAVIKNSNGDTWLGDVTGDLRLIAANGNIAVDRAHTTVTAKTSIGNVRIGEVARGSVVLQAASGELEVGIREGTAAWLDVKSDFGKVHNSLGAADRPEESDDTVEVRGRTSIGDIVIHRS